MTGVFTSCSRLCGIGAEYDGFGGLVEPGWRWDDEFMGWLCPDCQVELRAERIAEWMRGLPFPAWTFPA